MERDAREVSGIELESARILTKYYAAAQKRIIQKIKDRMALGIPDDPRFTEARLAVALEHIDSELRRLSQITGQEVALSSEMMVDHANRAAQYDLAKLEQKFEGISTIYPWKSVEISMDRAQYLVNNFQASIRRYSEELRGEMQRQLSLAVVERDTYTGAMTRLRTIMKAREWRAYRIARTELSNIYNSSKLDVLRGAKEEFLPDLMKTLYHPMDSRTAEDSKYLESLRMVIPIEEKFRYSWKGKVREFATPPDRPNDRAILIPVKGRWINQ